MVRPGSALDQHMKRQEENRAIIQARINTQEKARDLNHKELVRRRAEVMADAQRSYERQQREVANIRTNTQISIDRIRQGRE